MNTGMYKNVNVTMVTIMVVSVLCFINMDCSWFLDRATINRSFFALLTIVSGVGALATMKKAWLVTE